MKGAEKQIGLWSERLVHLVEITCFILIFVNSDQLRAAQCFSISFLFFSPSTQFFLNWVKFKPLSTSLKLEQYCILGFVF